MNRQGSTVIARSYAEALFRAAKAQGTLQRDQEECKTLAAVIGNSGRLVQFLGNPQVSTENKLALINKTLAARMSPLVVRTLELMIRRERMYYLPGVLEALQEMVEHAEGVYQAEVASASELGFQDKLRLKAALEKRTGMQLKIEFSVDPSLIGGVVFRLGDTLIDGSIKTGMEKLRRRLHHTTLTTA